VPRQGRLSGVRVPPVPLEKEGHGRGGRCARCGSGKVKTTLILAAVLAWCGAVWAQSPPRAEVMQKAVFVKRLLEGSPPEGGAILSARAMEPLGRGEEREADARLNEALRSLQSARRQAPAAARYVAL